MLTQPRPQDSITSNARADGALPAAVRHPARTITYPIGVILLGIAIRLVLIPLTSGPDFQVWDLASQATLHGQNIYANHPDGYPGGPFGYLPLFLYIELPLQWIAVHTGIPFQVLGKLPIFIGDLAVALAIGSELRRRGSTEQAQAVGVAMWFLNPLILYNSAWYGRFDSICVAFLMFAVTTTSKQVERGERAGDRSGFLVGAAIATKLFPIVVIPWYLWRSQHRLRSGLIIVAVCALVSLPYLLTSPHELLDDVVRYNSTKPPNGLTWQTVPRFGGASAGTLRLVRVGTIAASLGLFWYLRERSIWLFTTVAIGCFLLTSNIVLEQYLVWPLPFLIVLGLASRSWPAVFLTAWLTIAAFLMNHDIHPLGTQGVASTAWFNGVLAVGLVAGLAALVKTPKSVDPATLRFR